ncbi:MAG: ABC transporter permease [Paludibacteraceae bacterium]|nr:ABC transporter permease [Paludibacteraceae bacterium]
MSEYKYPIVKSFVTELQRIFRDPGVVVIFIVATLAYPLIYKALYWNEQINDVPVAVVDLSNSPQSREFLHRWNASPDIKLTHTCSSMAEAEQLLRDQKVHGIIYFPRDFERQLADPLGKAHISLYCDMSSFLYMKAIYLSCNQVMLESMRNIQIDRYEQMGMDKEFAWSLVQDAPYHETALFTPTGGYGSFLIPAVLVLILHQTLFFGICMLGGTAREENEESYTFTSLIGRAGACFLTYFGLAAILLGFFPRLFGIPHIGAIGDILLLIVPYLLAIIFFSLCVSVFIRNRESGLVLLISTSLIFLFMAGISWPKEMIPQAWRWVAACIPYTWGAHAFIHINSMGATLSQVTREFIALWVLTGAYGVMACVLFYIRKEREALRQKKEC